MRPVIRSAQDTILPLKALEVKKLCDVSRLRMQTSAVYASLHNDFARHKRRAHYL
jgi:hypothetical protein